MSLRHTSGSSLVEVMVMMVILGVSIVGIYSMVDSGKRLASLTDARLTALNIAREGLESVTTLRDTFSLNGYESGSCNIPPSINAFFSVNGHILLDSPDANCPVMSTVSPPTAEHPYILKDDKTLTPESTNFNVCINEFGWYSQEFSVKSSPTIACSDETDFCAENTTQSCKTRFKRKITFSTEDSSSYTTACGNINNPQYCVEVTSKVWW